MKAMAYSKNRAGKKQKDNKLLSKDLPLHSQKCPYRQRDKPIVLPRTSAVVQLIANCSLPPRSKPRPSVHPLLEGLCSAGHSNNLAIPRQSGLTQANRCRSVQLTLIPSPALLRKLQWDWLFGMGFQPLTLLAGSHVVYLYLPQSS